MQFLTHHRSSIKRLGLFPSRRANKHTGDEERILRPFLPEKTLAFYQYLTGFTSLTHLSGTPAWFKEKPFLALSRLPRLESIAIYFNEDDTRPYEDLDSLLSDNSFPLLRELTLDRSYLYQTSKVMQAKRFVGRLTTLGLGIEDIDVGFDDIHGSWEIGESNFPNLFRSVPGLNHLKVTVCESDVLLPFDYLTLQSLLELPLQSMVLHGITLEDVETTTGGPEVAWPQLTELRVPDHVASLYDISLFLAIPNLRYLELTLDLRNPKKARPFRELVPSTSLEVLKSSAGGQMCSSLEEVDTVARTLLSYWPGLKRIEWATTEAEHILSLVEQLNNQLAVVRQSQTLDQTSGTVAQHT
ncbi:hypothetical protein FRC06_000802 [Ceratobasidium sp. 370]|nr:hypothetical protein FRC06_000802 [Ceratobasidium sp. 370]